VVFVRHNVWQVNRAGPPNYCEQVCTSFFVVVPQITRSILPHRSMRKTLKEFARINSGLLIIHSQEKSIQSEIPRERVLCNILENALNRGLIAGGEGRWYDIFINFILHKIAYKNDRKIRPKICAQTRVRIIQVNGSREKWQKNWLNSEQNR